MAGEESIRVAVAELQRAVQKKSIAATQLQTDIDNARREIEKLRRDANGLIEQRQRQADTVIRDTTHRRHADLQSLHDQIRRERHDRNKVQRKQNQVDAVNQRAQDILKAEADNLQRDIDQINQEWEKQRADLERVIAEKTQLLQKEQQEAKDFGRRADDLQSALA